MASPVAQLRKSPFAYLFADWPEKGDEEEKARMVRQLEELNARRPLEEYCATAKKLLAGSGEISVDAAHRVEAPDVCSMRFASPEFFAWEEQGAAQAMKSGFVLVAGGLGERLGVSEIKVALETESTTHTNFLTIVLQSLSALRAKELCIMTSDDTHDRTVALLQAIPHPVVNVTLVKQGRVPAIADRQGHIAKQGRYTILEKPHGHGDVHSLLLASGTARRWQDMGLKWLCILQDSNPFAIHALVVALGVSEHFHAAANVLAVPRLAKSAAGMLCKVNGQTRNIEYNQVDHFLPHGDCNDPATGFSPYPGNTNQLVFALDEYNKILEQSRGSVPEFINPKYRPGTDEFDKPTRLECLMQDIFLFLPREACVKVTLINDLVEPIVPQAHPVYAPSKNDRNGAKRLRALGAADGSAASSEISVYASNYFVLKQIGVVFPPPPECFSVLTVDEAHFNVPPRVVVSPEVMPTWGQAKAVFPSPEKVSLLTASSCLVVQGPGSVVIHELELDGFLWIKALHPKSSVVLVKAQVRNSGGYELVGDLNATKGFTVKGDATVRIIEARGPGVMEIRDL